MNKEDDQKRLDKLIDFFRTFQQKKPRPDQADYSTWDQTEEAYQKQQTDWLRKVKQRKQKNQQSDE
jgi:hypothetical protein